MVKFLIVRFSSIGDIVLTTPVIRCLKLQVEGAEVHFVTKKKFQQLLQPNPYISKVHVLDNNFTELMKELDEENFDYIIDLHHNIRTLRLKRRLNHISFTFKKLNWQKWLLVNFKINRLPKEHIVDRYMDTLSVFSVVNDGKGLDFFITAEEEVNIEKYSSTISSPFLLIVVGGGHFTKQIPAEKIIEFIGKVHYPIILLGSKDDETKAKSIVDAITKPVLNLTGKLSIGQSASVVRQSTWVVTPDTGLMHIAAAFKKNILSVWGNTLPEFGMYPYEPGADSATIQIKELSCRPCSKIGFSKCPKGHFKCMADISVNEMTKHIHL